MAIVSTHARLLWGAFELDIAENQTPTYVAPTDYKTLGPDATPSGGIGVRRAVLHFNRNNASPADDDLNMHFDFLNYTAGEPDDTWITADFTTLEGLLQTWWTTAKLQSPLWNSFYRISWHRIGAGIVPPNPAVRILDFAAIQGSVVSPTVAPQQACSITFRTAVRRSWGRTYFPLGKTPGTNGRFGTTEVDALANTTRTLFSSAAAADFMPVVVSRPLNSALGIEAVETDDTIDIVRRRRWKHTVYRKIVTV